MIWTNRLPVTTGTFLTREVKESADIGLVRIKPYHTILKD